MATIAIRAVREASEYPQLVEIWRSSVAATHDFLAESDRVDIEQRLVSDYFPQVSLLVAERDGRPVGFAGVVEGSLEMLFVKADMRGTGMGSALLEHAMDEFGVRSLDVNEQNSQAVEFYRHQGFEVVGRSEVDDQGRPYPLLHMRVPAVRADARRR